MFAKNTAAKRAANEHGWQSRALRGKKEEGRALTGGYHMVEKKKEGGRAGTGSGEGRMGQAVGEKENEGKKKSRSMRKEKEMGQKRGF